jgi:DNA-binding NarL/FixJ family response regulator
MTDLITVIIVDRHRLVCDGLARILAAESDLRVVATCTSPADAVAQGAKSPVQVVIVDANLPDVETLTRQLLAGRTAPRILILATDCRVRHALSLLEFGVTSYLCKDASPQDLVAAVRHTSRKEMVLDPGVARGVIEQFTHASRSKATAADDPREVLTDRELNVLTLLCEGGTDKEIAQRLCISIRTVNGHLRHIYAKLGVHSRTEAMHVALEKGWVNLAIAGVLLLLQSGQF